MVKKIFQKALGIALILSYTKHVNKRGAPQEDGDCTVCSMVNYGRDCHNRPITKLEWSRRMANMTQAELAKKSGVNIRQIQRVELGESDAGNLTAKNLIAIAEVLSVTPKALI